MNISNIANVGLIGVTLLLSTFSIQAANLIINGGFDTPGVTESFSINNPTAVPGWTAVGAGSNTLDCLIVSGDTDNLCGSSFGGGLTFWINPGSSPLGGNYVGMDSDREFSKPLTQTVDGLTVGQQYDISFWQASGQQKGDAFFGVTTEQWEVTLGSQSQFSTLMTTPSHGSIDWNFQTLTFTATDTSELLTFFAKGTPSGQPPFAFLDGISFQESNSVPEPEAYTLLGIGLLGILAVRRQQKNRCA
ncbi:MAG: PEP-CTERM sorting domain-containing protein [Methylovulum sp.]|uniref:PEP-CTERM sorting domain-containing protein n=1 Tax=Methylovulum sp. TaxID=1916980 RepID=UPI002628C325|nr:PEP-CTERM sorting domain-containing protein [Methylovulum sp.]MDD2722456.1 PEP-CTERM sorting domain-containing protein [Methylovulum sp.]MDD5124494.1 PEP-CTERM sorting domain-containing protein [Methylovulum sp.]